MPVPLGSIDVVVVPAIDRASTSHGHAITRSNGSVRRSVWGHAAADDSSVTQPITRSYTHPSRRAYGSDRERAYDVSGEFVLDRAVTLLVFAGVWATLAQV